MSFVIVLYLAGSAVAIGLLALLLHRLGRSRRAAFSGEEAVRDLFALEFPDEEVTGVDLSADRAAAMVVLAAPDRAGLARAMGAHALARLVSADDIVAVGAQSGKVDSRLRLRLRDYADPVFTIDFDDPQVAEAWRQRLGSLAQDKKDGHVS